MFSKKLIFVFLLFVSSSILGMEETNRNSARGTVDEETYIRTNFDNTVDSVSVDIVANDSKKEDVSWYQCSDGGRVAISSLEGGGTAITKFSNNDEDVATCIFIPGNMPVFDQSYDVDCVSAEPNFNTKSYSSSSELSKVIGNIFGFSVGVDPLVVLKSAKLVKDWLFSSPNKKTSPKCKEKFYSKNQSEGIRIQQTEEQKYLVERGQCGIGTSLDECRKNYIKNQYLLLNAEANLAKIYKRMVCIVYPSWFPGCEYATSKDIAKLIKHFGKLKDKLNQRELEPKTSKYCDLVGDYIYRRGSIQEAIDVVDGLALVKAKIQRFEEEIAKLNKKKEKRELKEIHEKEKRKKESDLKKECNKFELSKNTSDDTQYLNREFARVDETKQALDMVTTPKEDFSVVGKLMSKEEIELHKELQNQYLKLEEILDPSERISRKIAFLYENKASLNKAATDYPVNRISLEHQEALHKLKIAAEKAVSSKEFHELFKDWQFDLSGINSNILNFLDLDSSEKLSNSTDLQNEMMKTAISHIKEIDATHQKYSNKRGVIKLTEKNLDCLKNAVECIKSNNVEKALDLLENSWRIIERIQFSCSCYDAISDAKSTVKGLYSSGVRAINLPQRLRDLKHAAYSLAKGLAYCGEIEWLIEQGKHEQAIEKIQALEQNIFNAARRLKKKWTNSSRDEKFFFLGEMIGSAGTIRLEGAILTRGLRWLGPKAAKAVEAIEVEFNQGLQKFRKGSKTLPKATVTTPEGLTLAMEGAEEAVKDVQKAGRIGYKSSNIPAKVEGHMWLAGATKDQSVRSYQEIARVLRRGKFFERVHDLDCKEIFRLHGDRCKIQNPKILKALREEGIDLSEIMWDGNSLKHICGIDRKSNGRWSGWHVDYKLQGAKLRIIDYDKIAMTPQGDVIVLRIAKGNGAFAYKSRFSPAMCNEKAFGEILKTINSSSRNTVKIQGSRIIIDCIGENSIPIKIVLEANGKLVTAYPCFSKELYQSLNYFDISNFLKS